MSLKVFVVEVVRNGKFVVYSVKCLRFDEFGDKCVQLVT